MNDTTDTQARTRSRPNSGPKQLKATQWRFEFASPKYALVILTVFVFLTFSFLPATNTTFPTGVNIGQILSNQAALTILAMGALIPLVADSFDLSIAANAGVAAVAVATSMSRYDQSLIISIVIGILLATAIGALNGCLIAYLHLNPFIVTLGGYALLIGLVNWYTDQQNITTGISPALMDFGSSEWLGIPRVTYLAAAAVLFTWYLVGHHPYGRQVQAIGSNARAAELVGINVRRKIAISFGLSGLLAGICGVAMASTSYGAIISQGPSLLFPMLTVVFLSATVITPGRYNILGTVIAIIFVSGSVSGLILAGASDWVYDAFNGAALIVAVIVSTLLTRRSIRHDTLPPPNDAKRDDLSAVDAVGA